MKLNRRKAVLGLGAMATGSGAVFSSAAFQSSVSPGAEMRVVVGQNFGNNLRVDAGDIFRGPGGSFNPSSGSNAVETVHNVGDTDFFGSNELADLTVQDLPAAGANNDDYYNNQLSLAVATAVGETATIGNDSDGDTGFIQVENNTPDNHDIQIEFNSFGTDVGGGQYEVPEAKVKRIYKFYDSSGNPISEDRNGNIPNSVTVESGKTEQIYLKVDTETNDLYSDVMDATSTADSQFTTNQDTVDLVEDILVGVAEN